VLHPTDARKETDDHGSRGGIRERAAVRSENDLIGITRAGREPALQQVERMLRVRAGEREVLGRSRATA